MTIGERLRKLRINKNLGQKEIAAILGLSITGYSSYENNSRRPSLDAIIQLSKFYGVSTDFLLGVEGKTDLNKNEIAKQLENIKNKIEDLEMYIKNSK